MRKRRGPRVTNDLANETIGEVAYKNPDATNDEIHRLCRQYGNVPVSMTQVIRAMRELRALRKAAFEHRPEDDFVPGGPDYDTRDQEG